MSKLNEILRLLVGAPPAAVRRPLHTATTMPTSDELPCDTEAQAVVADIVREAIAAGDRYKIKLSGSERYGRLKDDPPELQLAVIAAVAETTPRRGSRSYAGNSWQVQEARKQLLSQLLRRKLEVPAELQCTLLETWLASGYSLEYADLPGVAVIGAVERYAADHGLPEAVRPWLQRIDAKLTDIGPHRRTPTKWERSVLDRITALLDPASVENRPPLPSGRFAGLFIEWVEQQPEGQRESWLAFAAHAAGAADKSAPAKKWLGEAEKLVEALGKPVFASGLLHWLGATKPDPASPDHSLDVLKGLVWAAPLAGSEELAGAVGRFAEMCFRKVRGVGARSVKLGNAALYALSEMAGAKQAGAELFRLRGAIKYPSARTLLDKRIAELADASGSDVAALEDAALPDHGIGPDSTLRVDFGAAHALLTVSTTGTEVAWANADGKAVKAPPAAVKTEFAEELAAFKLAMKDIEKSRAAQGKRLEESWLEGRSWQLGDWRTHYAGHNLRRVLVEALVWQVTPTAGEPVAVIPAAGELHDVAGRTVELPDDARVALWHPLQAEPETVLAWRRRIVDLGLTQPIKQAHREIYVLTEAERQTGIYSNRFAAHILRQHQFRALCQARGWQYDFMGGWDSWNIPTRTLPALGISVQYSVEAIHDGERSAAYVPLHITTDQVRFVNLGTGESMSLLDVEPVVFSELMRDVDLFVAVTSVANDPTWTDGGPNGQFGTYWHTWAFGDLSQTAETRKALIADIVPRLSIADKLQVGDKALLVKGKRHDYAIHFGSTNIQIMPENRYLCIVPARNPAEAERIRLPFTGDSQLSTILAKAFMLVDESKIKDPTILRQL